MKKSLLILIAGSALSLFAAVPGRVTADRLNLRFAAELKSPVAGRVEKDAALQIYSVKGQWLEVAAPETLKVYVSEAYVANGKTIASLKMYSDKSSTSTCLGVLPAGSEVKLIDDRGYGWVRIAPPASIRLYAAKMYVEFDAAQLAKEDAEKSAPAAPAVAAPAPAPAAPAAPAEAKIAEVKPAEVKPAEVKPAEAKAAEAPVAVPAPKEDVK